MILVKRPPSEYLPARPPPQDAVFNMYELKTQPELVRYLHASAGFPTKPMWLRAVRNRQYASWPGLTPEAVSKHFPITRPTTKERNIFVQIYNVEGDEAILKMYTDQTGCFPKKSSR